MDFGPDLLSNDEGLRFGRQSHRRDIHNLPLGTGALSRVVAPPRSFDLPTLADAFSVGQGRQRGADNGGCLARARCRSQLRRICPRADAVRVVIYSLYRPGRLSWTERLSRERLTTVGMLGLCLGQSDRDWNGQVTRCAAFPAPMTMNGGMDASSVCQAAGSHGRG